MGKVCIIIVTVFGGTSMLLVAALMWAEIVDQFCKHLKLGRLFYRFLCWRSEFEDFLAKKVDHRFP